MVFSLRRSHLICRRTGLAVLSLGSFLLSANVLRAQSLTVSKALSAALRHTQASAVVLDLRTGTLLASYGPEMRGTTGSVTKPIFLEYGLEHGVVTADTQVYCRRNLHVGKFSLPCTHPADEPVFTAKSALAESCNTWFAELGQRYSGPLLEAAMEDAGLHHASMTGADTEQRQLAVLGLRGVDATPMELARAYRSLLGRIPADGPVAQGLEGSVAYGMANQAAVKGLSIWGKTGTASDPHQAWTHGWFAGALPGNLVVVIFIPHGDGGTAAALARKFFIALPETRR